MENGCWRSGLVARGAFCLHAGEGWSGGRALPLVWPLRTLLTWPLAWRPQALEVLSSDAHLPLVIRGCVNGGMNALTGTVSGCVLKLTHFFIPAPHPRPQSSFPLELLPKQQQGLCVVIYFGVGFLSSSSFLFKWGRA